MADYSVPLNRVGVVTLNLVDISAQHTDLLMEHIDWSVAGPASPAHFDLVVAADGLSAEIQPISTGTGSVISIDISQAGRSTFNLSRSVEITANTSDPGPTGNDAWGAGTDLKIVQSIGRLI